MLQCETGNLWSILGHAVPLLGQPWVKMSRWLQLQRRTAARDPKSSFGTHPLLLHHSITSAWVQQRMLQCTTGNSWSILGHACLSASLGADMVENEYNGTGRDSCGRSKTSFGPHPMLLHQSATSAWVQQRKLQW